MKPPRNPRRAPAVAVHRPSSSKRQSVTSLGMPRLAQAQPVGGVRLHHPMPRAADRHAKRHHDPPSGWDHKQSHASPISMAPQQQALYSVELAPLRGKSPNCPRHSYSLWPHRRLLASRSSDQSLRTRHQIQAIMSAKRVMGRSPVSGASCRKSGSRQGEPGRSSRARLGDPTASTSSRCRRGQMTRAAGDAHRAARALSSDRAP